jgi:DNA polymerase-3 subunit gamma/tau
MAQIAAEFSEEDLTRYLQLTLDLFRDLQFSLQPRLHLEVGLLKLVHAGRLLPIEQALAMLESGGGAAPLVPKKPEPAPPAAPPRMGPSPFARDAARKSAPAPSPDAATGTLKERLHAWLTARGMSFIADAVEHAGISEAPNALVFSAPREFSLSLRSSDLKQAVEAVLGKPVKITVESVQGSGAPVPAPSANAGADQAAARALANPEVQRFLEAFAGSQVRVVRNLKE